MSDVESQGAPDQHPADAGTERPLPDSPRQVAEDKVIAFAERFGLLHLDLACHASVPLVLTAEMLYQIWAVFVREAPWTAVADILLSSLCYEVSYEVYALDPAVQAVLLKRLRAMPDRGQARLEQVARLVQSYITKRDDDASSSLTQAQEWAVRAYTEPQDVVSELALAFPAVDTPYANAQALQLANLVLSFADPLQSAAPSDYSRLREYAKSVQSLAQGDDRGAAEALASVSGPNGRVHVAGRQMPFPFGGRQPGTQGAETVVPDLPTGISKPTPPGNTFRGCPAEGDGGDRQLNVRRNRIDTASWIPVDVNSILKQTWPSGVEGKSRSQWSSEDATTVALYEGIPVQVEGYLAGLKKEGSESRNCHSPTEVTWRLWITDEPGQDRAQSVLGDISPRVRAFHPGWTFERLQRLVTGGSPRVRMSGWLLLDQLHPDQVGRIRGSLWMVDPVVQMDVILGEQWLPVDSLGPAVFVSYDPRDQRWYDRLGRLLTQISRDGTTAVVTSVDVQSTTNEEATGRLDRDRLERALAIANVGVVLVSQSYLDLPSTGEELARMADRAKEGRMVVYWLLVSESNWEKSPLATSLFEPVGDADNPRVPEIPLDQLPRDKQDRVFGDLYNRILRATQESATTAQQRQRK